MPTKYNSPPAVNSSIGPQINTHYYERLALIEAQTEKFFGQLADVTAMPKHMGKKIKRFHYIPLLDAENINDQGLDAAGAIIDTDTYDVYIPNKVTTYTVEQNATDAATAINAIEAGVAVKGGSGSAWTVTVSKNMLDPATETQADDVLDKVPGSFKNQRSGNLYGSSKDIGYIPGKLPALSETGGRVNRVGYRRKELEGTFEKFGFFDEYTKESLDFDTDAELQMHVNREMINGAMELTEAALQIDLITNANTVRYPGAATKNLDMDASCEITYKDFMRLAITLDMNRTPKHTKILSGTRMIDTRTIPAARVAYIGSELIPTIKDMLDLHARPAFIPAEQYAAGTTLMNGEIGSLDQFRIVVVPEMFKWSGAGAPVGNNTTLQETNGRFDVFPILVVGSGSFTTIGFETTGRNNKFTIYHMRPGEAAATRYDPYGEVGFMSIKWYYGFMALRPERIALMKSVAQI